MATTKIWAIKADLASAISYIGNPNKTEALKAVIDYAASDEKTYSLEYRSGINCDIDNALEEMQAVKRQFAKEGGILAHHAEQSFAPGEVTADKAHEIGVAFAEEMWGDRFQVIVCTHLDKAHIHNHFILNSVSFIDGKKYNGCKATYKRMRELSDERCRNEGLSVVELPKDKGISRAIWNIENEGRVSIRSLVKKDIDYAISRSKSEDSFYQSLRDMGYRLKFAKHIALLPPGKDKHIRLKSLGDEYLPEDIRKRIAENYSKNYGIIYTGKRRMANCKKPQKKLTGYKALYVRYLFALGKIPSRKRHIKPSHYTVRQVRYLDKISSQSRLIFLNDISNENDLRVFSDSLSKELVKLEAQRAEKRAALRRKQAEPDATRLKAEIAEITEQMRQTRNKIKTCEDIKSNMKEVQAVNTGYNRKTDRKEVRINEHGSRDRRDDR
ncbi:MAG: relaxase/mobilization nuclease domain-containing protein [Clostridiales bacterium]|nr:relaxase/mobilization nuclease domain-containing protein [Clostridiales bacterium]